MHNKKLALPIEAAQTFHENKSTSSLKTKREENLILNKHSSNSCKIAIELEKNRRSFTFRRFLLVKN